MQATMVSCYRIQYPYTENIFTIGHLLLDTECPIVVSNSISYSGAIDKYDIHMVSLILEKTPKNEEETQCILKIKKIYTCYQKMIRKRNSL